MTRGAGPSPNVLQEILAGAAAAPARTALVVDGGAGGESRAISYGALASGAAAFGERLAGHGIARGDRCGLVAPQGPGFVAAALGILAAGGCLVPVGDDPDARGLDAVRREARLTWIVRARGAGAAPDDGLALDVERAGTGLPPFPREAEFRALDPAYLRFTSGTTRLRKGVVLGHASVRARLDAANAALGIGPDDTVLWQLPMAHHFVVSILLYLRQGAKILLPASGLARPALALAEREGATVLYASPFHHRLLARDAGPAKLGRLRLAVSTAEGLRRDVADAFLARFGRPLVQALGVIECGLPVVNLASAASKPLALGRPLPAYDVWLRGESGLPVTATGPEHTGELCIRGPGLLDAYLEPWTTARGILEPDGFRTGDEAWRDADGDLHLAGRRANRVSVAGMKFFCEEVEAVLDAHPAVRRSRVSAREHPHLGEIPVADVVPRRPEAPPDAETLRTHCRERLAAHQVPREFRLVADLPSTASGKLLRTGRRP